eukprot:CAMPEP_0114689512 /NCGR_PEP_ID=MMETSP0191-20121206/64622_1 /TAXON_ID=126664 /ORGANISM="Sorites sp." /LENGTH=38 /DNA_ID= /DNA_START= /DNA_END= /DNA_ORIENTATION=
MVVQLSLMKEFEFNLVGYGENCQVQASTSIIEIMLHIW